MKKFLIILFLFLTPILGIAACNPKKKGDNQEQKDKEDKDKEDKDKEDKDKEDEDQKQNDNQKWKVFSKDIEAIIKNKFKVKNQIEKILEIDDCQNCITTSQKLIQYKELESEFYKLPKINNNVYLKKINKIFKTMRFWIFYLNGDNNEDNLEIYKKGNKAERKLSDIFDGLNNKKIITFKNVEINNMFGNWNYENDSKDTQIKLLEFIEYHYYIDRTYVNLLKEYKKDERYRQKIEEKTFYAQLNVSENEKKNYFEQKILEDFGKSLAVFNKEIWLDIN